MTARWLEAPAISLSLHNGSTALPGILDLACRFRMSAVCYVSHFARNTAIYRDFGLERQHTVIDITVDATTIP